MTVYGHTSKSLDFDNLVAGLSSDLACKDQWRGTAFSSFNTPKTKLVTSHHNIVSPEF